MAATQNQPNINLPQRSITITGPMTARLYQASVRASRIDLRATQVALAHPSVRDPSNRAIERFMQAVARFESEMTMVEKDLDNASRTGPARRNGQQGEGQASRQPARDNRSQPKASEAGAGSTAAKAANAAGGAQAQSNTPPQGKKRTRTRNKNKASGAGEVAQASQPQKPATPQQQAPKEPQAPTTALAAPVAAQVAAPAPVQPQAVKPADVPSNIQAL